MNQKKPSLHVKIKSFEQIADAFQAGRERRFPVYEGPNCLSIFEGILYVDGKMTPEDCQRWDDHIRTCLYCSRRTESLRRTARKLEIPEAIVSITHTSAKNRPLAAGGSSDIIYEGPEFKISLGQDRTRALILVIETEKEEYIGKMIRVSVLSARKFIGAAEDMVNWVDGSPDEILSAHPIPEPKAVEIAIGTTQLRLNHPEDRKQIDEIFKEIEVELFELKE